MSVKLLTKDNLEFLGLKGGCTGSTESTLVKMPHCWKSHVKAHFMFAVPPTPVTVFPFEYLYSNFDGLSKEELHEMLSREFKSKAVRKNSPYGWNAYIDIERLETEDQNIISRSKRNIAGATGNIMRLQNEADDTSL